MFGRIQFIRSAFIILQIFFSTPGLFGQDLILTTPIRNNCTKEMIRNLDSIANYYYGVTGSGFIGNDEYIGKDCFAKKQWAGPWKPVDGYKRTVCGKLFIKKRKNPFVSSKNEKYHLISDGDGDMVIYIIPDSAFQWLQLKSLRPHGHLHNEFSIAGEIALKNTDKEIEANAAAYIKSLNLDSIQFKPVGFYGPWVSDVRNDNSPEIHPLQQMWRREILNDSVTEFQLYSFFDNSSRYNDKDDFTGDCRDQVWAPNPLLNTFYIPFEISIKDTHRLNYDFYVPSSKNINPVEAQDKQIRLIVNGITEIEVNKSDASFPKISFYEVCQTDEQTIHGYLKIETSIGLQNTNEAAHAIIKVLQKKMPKVY